MELILVIVLRAVERLIGIIIGGLLAWLGYRLFLDVPVKGDSSGNFKLAGGSEIKLTRIAPGIFFSLFGTAIVFVSFLKPVNLTQTQQDVAAVASIKAIATEGRAAPGASSFNGAAPGGTIAPDAREAGREERRRTITALNNLPAALKPDLTDPEKFELKDEIRKAKLAVMEPVWGADWGDFVLFKKWIESIEAGPPPNAVAAAYYLGK
ncbi:MAG: hypothetical protein ABIP20_15115 [Chthoniobacteraceae bacterium]